jgi:hypothetical protein
MDPPSYDEAVMMNGKSEIIFIDDDEYDLVPALKKSKKNTRPGKAPAVKDEDLTPRELEKRERRRKRNKLAAQNQRLKKSGLIESLERQKKDLTEENGKIEKENQALKAELKNYREVLQDHPCVGLAEPRKQPITVSSDGRDELNRELDEQNLDLDELLNGLCPHDFPAVQDLSQELHDTFAQETHFEGKTKIPMPPQDLSGKNVETTPDFAKQPMTVRSTPNVFFPSDMDVFQIAEFLDC